ncbi:hypothetical protein C8Q79DRAFT_26735 [Trametes meyenii]|nr:hypothetical protein C8Q79DRAFT_26735 [Trametes meyenii]
MAPYTSASSLSIISQTLYEPPVPVAVSGTFTPHTPSRATFVPPSVFQPETTHQCELIVELARREGKTVHVTDSGSDPNNVMVDVTGMSGQLILLTDKLDAVTEELFDSCSLC